MVSFRRIVPGKNLHFSDFFLQNIRYLYFIKFEIINSRKRRTQGHTDEEM